MSSLKSPSITQGVLHSVTCLNSLVSTVIKITRGTLGDLYTTAICILLTLSKLWSALMSGNLASIDLTFNNAMVMGHMQLEAIGWNLA